uniref:Uncharacterized protein n=1 Tax=Globisporangium ultimum (strain ATCC 200006 / CBS 805.95 / DAOM BR144) TaxID=431595 RepID=K3WNJ9_GLOUD
MEELNQFLNSVEASARKILKHQNKKQQELIARDRVALARGGKHDVKYQITGSTDPSVSRDELRATYGASGSSLIIRAPSPLQHPPDSPGGRRSEHVSETQHQQNEDDKYLPRLPQQSWGGNEPMRGSASTGTLLPAILDKKQQQKDALEAAKKTNRDKRASTKILDSPLYKSLSKVKSEQGFASSSSPQAIKKAIHDVDNVNILLKKMGLRESSSPSRRPDHAVERRMCNACWARPNKLTGCEHHRKVVPTNHDSHDAAAIVRSLELQGPKSWLSGDLFVKYRSESDREALWNAYLQLKEDEKRREQEQEEQELLLLQGLSSSPDLRKQPQELKVIPIITRHPICAKFFTQTELENLRTQAETRKRNQSKAFIFDVNHIWLTNLDHFNTRMLKQKRSLQRQQIRQSEAVGDDEWDPHSDADGEDESFEHNALADRRDEAAIQQGYSQIQSISTTRALQNAIFPEFDPSQSSFSIHRQSSLVSSALNDGKTQQQHPRRRDRKRAALTFHPLSLLVCGRWQQDAQPNLLETVPGVAIMGSAHILWWQYPHDEKDEHGKPIEFTKPVTMYARDTTLSSSNAILVSLVVALDAPVLSQFWFAWHIGSKMPPAPIPAADPGLSHVPCRVSPCIWSLVNTKLQSRIDSLMPCTIVLLNDVAWAEDHVRDLDDPYGHRRVWSEMNPDSFRQWWLVANSLEPNFDVDPQECSVQIAQPNATGVCGRFCWHSVDAVDQSLCRRWLERDYVYIVQNRRPNGSNDSMYFIVSMAHEAMLDVRAAKLSAYLAMIDERRRKKEYEAKLIEIEQKLEVGRLVLEAKRLEQKRIEQELEAAVAVKKQHESGAAHSRRDTGVLQEWEARMKCSIVKEEQGDWQLREITADDSQVVFYHSLNQHLPPIRRFSWDRPEAWQDRLVSEKDDEFGGDGDDGGNVTSRSDTSSISSSSSSFSNAHDGSLDAKQRENDETMAQITKALLEDEEFLHTLKEKLGFTALESTVNEQATRNVHMSKSKRNSANHNGDDEEEADQLDWNDQMMMLTEESDHAKASFMVTKMAKLQLAPHKVQTTPAKPGEGWKRLKVTKLPKNFARSVYSAHTEGPRSPFINQPNNATPVGMIDPAESSLYETPEFIPELRAHFIPRSNADLLEKKAIWAEYERSKPKMVNGTAVQSRNAGAPLASLEELLERDPAEAQMSMDDLVNKAILCARNNNLEGLENALDSGADPNSRDNYGNTLFILVCQQGNKRLAKFLLRRRADMNLQNMNGNTGLHYLYEYKHKELAEYLKTKGAIDTIQNASGLTCYEGLSTEKLDQL